MLAERATSHPSFGVQPEAVATTGMKLESAGLHIARYSLVLVLVWIGAMKFTAYEAGAIQPLVANSPLMSWLYAVFSVQATSNLIGVAEIAAGGADRAAALVAVGGGAWQPDGGRDFRRHLDLPVLDPGLGAEPGRLSRALGGARPVHPEGRRPARRRHLVARRGPAPRRFGVTAVRITAGAPGESPGAA